MSLFGVGLQVEVTRLNTQFKIFIQKKGGFGVRPLAELFRRYDNKGIKKLTPDQFTSALADFG